MSYDFTSNFDDYKIQLSTWSSIIEISITKRVDAQRATLHLKFTPDEVVRLIAALSQSIIDFNELRDADKARGLR